MTIVIYISWYFILGVITNYGWRKFCKANGWDVFDNDGFVEFVSFVLWPLSLYLLIGNLIMFPIFEACDWETDYLSFGFAIARVLWIISPICVVFIIPYQLYKLIMPDE